MAVYTDAEQLYTYVRALFAKIAEENPGAADAVLASRLVIRLHCTGPDAEITLNGRKRPSWLDCRRAEAYEQIYHIQHRLRLPSSPPV
jgi:hypothetical protein